MERYIFDPRYSLNPACTPITLNGETRIVTIEFSEYRIINDTPETKTLRMNQEAAEAGERITGEMPSGTKHDLQAVSTPKSWEGRSRTVIGDTSDK